MFFISLVNSLKDRIELVRWSFSLNWGNCVLYVFCSINKWNSSEKLLEPISLQAIRFEDSVET